MGWHRDAITQGEIDALCKAAQGAWAEDTRYPLSPRKGQCYVTARWLVSRLGGKIGRTHGHYFWLSPDDTYLIDLTGDHSSKPIYSETKNWWMNNVPIVDNERTRRFTKRANRIFEHMLKYSDQIGDAYPAEEPERATQLDQDTGPDPYWHDEPGHQPENAVYKFVYGNGQLEISPSHDHTDLAEHARVPLDHTGPMAVGYVNMQQGRATWEVQSNVNLKALERVFKDYGKQVGWQWGGLTDIDGEPVSDEFAPKKAETLNWLYAHDHLYLGPSPHAELVVASGDAESGAGHAGTIRVLGRKGFVSPVVPSALSSLQEWASDEGLTLYAWNDNRLHTVPDLELDNLYTPNPTKPEESQFFNEKGEEDPTERDPSGLMRCPMCDALLPNWYEYQAHRRAEHGEKREEPIDNGNFPQMEENAIQDSHFTPQQPEVMPLAKVHAARVDGFRGGDDDDEYFVAFDQGSPIGYARMRGERLLDMHMVQANARLPLYRKIYSYKGKEPKDLLEAPIPFIFDIDQDKLHLGRPGQRSSDIPGRFTPGGMVEGVYEKGKMILRTITNTPYSAYHLATLWYYTHPELTITGIYLKDDAGGTTKLAESQSVGGYVAALVQSDPAAAGAARALKAAGGHVYAVGGAVRDAVLGKDPKDVDLMVTGLQPNQIEQALGRLPGHTQVTGQDFAVHRYRDPNGNDVEVSIPRKDRSTGPGHQDFDVQADPHMSPEEDFYRRDFTANAMGVDLDNGHLIDPYNGVNDIRNGVLRTVNPNALSEDPLRVVRALSATSRHGLSPDLATQADMTTNAPSLQHLAPERVQEELDKLFTGEDPASAVRLAHQTGVLPYIFPEVDRAFGFDQNNPHHELELGDHLTQVLDRTSKLTTDPDLRLAALLHDIGKPDSAWVDPITGSNHYYESRGEDGQSLGADHEDLGAEMARNAMTRLRYPSDRIQRVGDLVQHHMWPAFTSGRGARRFLNRVGDHADDLFTLREADQGGKSYNHDPAQILPDLTQQQQLVNKVRQAGEPTNRSQLAINGQDLINAGIPQGPQIGQVLERLTQDVIEDPRLNNPQMLLTKATEYASLQGP